MSENRFVRIPKFPSAETWREWLIWDIAGDEIYAEASDAEYAALICDALNAFVTKDVS